MISKYGTSHNRITLKIPLGHELPLGINVEKDRDPVTGAVRSRSAIPAYGETRAIEGPVRVTGRVDYHQISQGHAIVDKIFDAGGPTTLVQLVANGAPAIDAQKWQRFIASVLAWATYASNDQYDPDDLLKHPEGISKAFVIDQDSLLKIVRSLNVTRNKDYEKIIPGKTADTKYVLLHFILSEEEAGDPLIWRFILPEKNLNSFQKIMKKSSRIFASALSNLSHMCSSAVMGATDALVSCISYTTPIQNTFLVGASNFAFTFVLAGPIAVATNIFEASSGQMALSNRVVGVPEFSLGAASVGCLVWSTFRFVTGLISTLRGNSSVLFRSVLALLTVACLFLLAQWWIGCSLSAALVVGGRMSQYMQLLQLTSKIMSYLYSILTTGSAEPSLESEMTSTLGQTFTGNIKKHLRQLLPSTNTARALAVSLVVGLVFYFAPSLSEISIDKLREFLVVCASESELASQHFIEGLGHIYEQTQWSFPTFPDAALTALRVRVRNLTGMSRFSEAAVPTANFMLMLSSILQGVRESEARAANARLVDVQPARPLSRPPLNISTGEWEQKLGITSHSGTSSQHAHRTRPFMGARSSHGFQAVAQKLGGRPSHTSMSNDHMRKMRLQALDRQRSRSPRR